MSEEQPEWMGCAAHDPVIASLPLSRFARDLGHLSDAWRAAHACLILERPVRFEDEGSTGYYIAPHDPNMVGLPARALIASHVKLDELGRGRAAPPARTENLPAVLVRPFQVRFQATIRLPCHTTVQATDARDAERVVRDNWDQVAQRLFHSAHSLFDRWDPEPADFDFLGAEPVSR